MPKLAAVVLVTFAAGCSSPAFDVSPAPPDPDTGSAPQGDSGAPDGVGLPPDVPDAPASDSGVGDAAPEACARLDPLVACRYPACGDVPDGCGGEIHCADKCAAESAHDTCGGGGAPHVCGCTPLKNVCETTCGSTDGCGGAVSCGSCFGGCSVSVGDGVVCPTSKRQVQCPTGTPTSPTCAMAARDASSEFWCCDP